MVKTVGLTCIEDVSIKNILLGEHTYGLVGRRCRFLVVERRMFSATMIALLLTSTVTAAFKVLRRFGIEER